MTNNNEQSIEFAQKAQFCKQYFYELQLFLSEFDLSDTKDEKGNTVHKDFLNMSFLTESFEETRIKRKDLSKEELDEEKNRIVAKNRLECKWSLGDINESELMFAIEEFYYITAQKETVKSNRNRFVENLLDLNIVQDVQTGIEDNTLKSILVYFGILKEDSDIAAGNLYLEYSKFARQISEPMDTYKQALFLLFKIRNWKTHPDLYFEGKKNKAYQKYVLFTYIGLVYACRILWKSIGSNKLEKDGYYYELPDKANLFTMPKYPVFFDISTTSGNKKISRFVLNYLGYDFDEDISSKELNHALFQVEIPKYQVFTVQIYYEGEEEPLKFDRVLNYYTWLSSIIIILPDEIKSIYNEDNGLSKATNELISQIVSEIRDCLDENRGKSIMQELGQIEPILCRIKNEGNNYVKKNIEERLTLGLKDLQNELEGDIFNVKQCVNNMHANLKELHSDYLSSTHNISDSLDSIISYTRETGNNTKRILKILENWQIMASCLFLLVLLVFPISSLYYCIAEPIKASVIWLSYPFILSIAMITILGLILFTLSIILDPIKNTKNKNNLKWSATAIVIIVFGIAFYLLPYHSRKHLTSDYEYITHSADDNEIVVSFFEKNILEDEENISIKLIHYYTDIVDDIKKAKQLSSPMLDVDKYKEGSLAAMYVLYKEKQYHTLRQYVDKYGSVYGEDNPNYCEMKGVLLVDTLSGYRDISKGIELLEKAYTAGSAKAAYYLGYIYSNDISSYEAIEEGRIPQISGYDLSLAIDLLKEASDIIPDASLLLGDIYSDLEMIDSAFFYYNKAVSSIPYGNILATALYKIGITYGKHGVIDNDELRFLMSQKNAPALLYSSIYLKIDSALISKIGNKPFSTIFSSAFYNSNRDHKSAISAFKEAEANENASSLNDMGVYQYVPPVVYDYVYLGEKDKALGILNKYRESGKFNLDFLTALEFLFGTPKVNANSLMGMKYMHESANQGCKFAELICIYKDTYYKICKDKNTSINTKRLDEIGKEIPYSFVIKSLLLMAAGKYYEAEVAANKAMWLHHPAGALAFEFMPDDYYDNVSTGIGNGLSNFSDNKLYLARKYQEMAMRMTWTAKDRSVLMSYKLDYFIHEKDTMDFTQNFKFWSEVAINSGSISSQVGLLRRYQLMVDSGYLDNDQLIEPLIYSIVNHMVHGDYDYDVYRGYVDYILKILSIRKYISISLLNKLLNSFSQYDLFYAIEGLMDKKVSSPLIRYSCIEQSFIDDFSLLNEFTYWCGPYAIWITDKGSNTVFYMNSSNPKDLLLQIRDNR